MSLSKRLSGIKWSICIAMGESYDGSVLGLIKQQQRIQWDQRGYGGREWIIYDLVGHFKGFPGGSVVKNSCLGSPMDRRAR